MDGSSPVRIFHRHPNLSPHPSETQARVEHGERDHGNHYHWAFQDFEDNFIVGQGPAKSSLQLCDSIAASNEYEERGNT